MGVVDNEKVRIASDLEAVLRRACDQKLDLQSLLHSALERIEPRRASRHYYEAHVTVEPVFEDRFQAYVEACAKHRFRPAKFFMQKRKSDTQERSKDDAFCTGRGIAYVELLDRTLRLVAGLTAAGFKVWRYKIESTLIDSRYDDSPLLLDKEGLPEKELHPRAPADGALAGRVGT